MTGNFVTKKDDFSDVDIFFIRHGTVQTTSDYL